MGKPTVRISMGMRIGDYIEKVVITLLNTDTIQRAIEFNKKAHSVKTNEEVIEISRDYVTPVWSKNCYLGRHRNDSRDGTSGDLSGM